MRKKLENSLEGQDIQKSDRSGFPGGVQITDIVFLTYPFQAGQSYLISGCFLAGFGPIR